MEIDWNKVIHYTQKGNPEPPRRVEKSDEEWKEELSDEQFQITRLKGTERLFPENTVKHMIPESTPAFVVVKRYLIRD